MAKKHETLWVCSHCLMAIECKEGKQASFEHHIDEDDDHVCDWCGESADTLYELV